MYIIHTDKLTQTHTLLNFSLFLIYTLTQRDIYILTHKTHTERYAYCLTQRHTQRHIHTLTNRDIQRDIYTHFFLTHTYSLTHACAHILSYSHIHFYIFSFFSLSHTHTYYFSHIPSHTHTHTLLGVTAGTSASAWINSL